jgi:7-cyano-7-deazaguanine synthase in queuosine biosynthesis
MKKTIIVISGGMDSTTAVERKEAFELAKVKDITKYIE